MGKTFWEDVKRGGLGESVVWNYLSSLDNVKEIIDVRKDRRYFNEEDVDFLIKAIDNNIYKVEVKTDFKAHETNNLFYEYESMIDKGCFDRTKSDVVYYFIPNNQTLLQIDVNKIKNYIDKNINTLKKVVGGDSAKGYLINIDTLENANVLKKITNFI